MAPGASRSTRRSYAALIERYRKRRRKALMHVLDLDPSSLRDWLASVGLLRIVSETTEAGRLVWRAIVGRYRLIVESAPDDLAQRCAAWVAANRGAWQFAGKQNVDFNAGFWREHAVGTTGIEAALWCALASDA